MAESKYDVPSAAAEAVKRRDHREFIGGMWEQLGALQLEFLVGQGLRPDHTLLDVGCGSLRGGVEIIPYLDPGQYWGIDNNSPLLDAGWDLELGPLGLRSRQPRRQLVALNDFEFRRLETTFDFAIAQSLFSHFSLNRIRRCLTRLADVMDPGGLFFATFFEVPGDQDPEQPLTHHPGGIVTHSDRDPYHYRVDDLEYAVHRSPWRPELIGEWGHPRGQRMMRFVRTDDG